MSGGELENLLEKIYRERGLDFRGYKKSSLMRRIQKRMHDVHAKSYLDYMRVLDALPQEYNELLEALTIKVTEFFRDAEVFKAVKEIVLPELVERKKRLWQRQIRIWCPACASGEEAYSVAMLLAEELGKELGSYDVKIYATDISGGALAAARAGEYLENKLKGVPEALRSKYFKAGKIDKKIRNMIIFGNHNLVTDPPISHLDALFCRNVLIYLTQELQKKLVPKLHAALEREGFLILGKSESIPTSMTNLPKRGKHLPIYQKL